jgi:hypothetical protein
MTNFFIDTLLPLAGTFAVGAAGWFIVNFFAEPLLDLSRLRREIHAAIFFTANVGEGSPSAEIATAQTDMRRLAAQLDAVDNVALRPIKWVFKVLGRDLSRARGGLVGLSNSLTTTRGEKAICRHDVETGLRFNVEHSDATIAKIRTRLAEPVDSPSMALLKKGTKP